MTLLNLAWQWIGIMRNKTTNFEQKLNSCNGLNAICAMAEKYPELKEEFLEAVQPAKNLMGKMLKRVSKTSGKIFTFNSSIENQLTQLEIELKKIQPDFSMDEMI